MRATGRIAASAEAASATAPPGWARAERIVAMLVVGAVAIRYNLPADIPLSFLVSLVVLPMTWRALAAHRWAVPISVLAILAAISGVVITESRSSEVAVSQSMMVSVSVRILLLVVVVACLLWARMVLGTRSTVLVFGVGSLLSLAVAGVNLDNIWKFSFAVPVTLVVLSLPWIWGHRVREILCLGALAGVSAFADSRSLAAMLAIAAMVLVLDRPSSRGAARSVGAWSALLRLAIIGVTAYLVVQAAILDGVLGEGVRERTELQIEQSGSALTGGRPEMGAAVALIADRPTGYGSGALVTYDERQLGKGGMAGLGYDPDNGYVDEYMFGRGFEVHSLIGDLWLRFGLVGALLAVVVLLVVVHRAGHGIATHAISAAALFLAVRAVWDFAFSPIGSVMLYLPLTLALLLPERERATSPSPRGP